MLERLLSFDADILCLQEMDEYESYYRSRLTKEGYSSVYIQRSGRKRDGCGIFFRRNRMELVDEQAVEFNDLVPAPTEVDKLGLSSEDEPQFESETVKDLRLEKSKCRSRSSSPAKAGPERRGDPNDPRVRLKRDCVAILAAFRMLHPPNKYLIFGNAHLYWDPEWADVKLAQARYLLLRIVNFQQRLSRKLDCNPLVLVCGDYNSTPGDPVYQYITSGSHESGGHQSSALERNTDQVLDASSPESGSGKNSGSTAGVSASSETAPLPLLSLYDEAVGEHPNTNVTPGFTGTLDYIFFRPSDSLRFTHLLSLPAPNSPDLEGGLLITAIRVTTCQLEQIL